MFAAESRGELPKGTAKKWADETEDIKNLPEKVQKEAKYLAGRAVGAREVVYGRRGGPISAETERQRAQERAKKSPRLQAIYEKLDDPSGKPLSFDKLPRETGMNKQADLRKWFADRWVDVSRKKKGGGHPPCGRDDADKGAYPKCLPAAKASKLTQKQKKSAVRRKRAGGQGESKTPKYVSTMKKQALFEKVAKNVTSLRRPFDPLRHSKGTMLYIDGSRNLHDGQTRQQVYQRYQQEKPRHRAEVARSLAYDLGNLYDTQIDHGLRGAKRKRNKHRRAESRLFEVMDKPHGQRMADAYMKKHFS